MTDLCPYVVTSDEGTGYCALAEERVRELEESIEEWRLDFRGLQERIRELEAEQDEWQERCGLAEMENDRLREAIESAPCPDEGLTDTGAYTTGCYQTGEPCNCWKSAALNTEKGK